MNFDSNFQTGLGIASAFSEILQEPEKLATYLTQIQQKPDSTWQELAEKGENMQRDIERFVQTYFGCQSKQSQYPLYVNTPSGQCFNQPYDVKETNLYGFVLEGKISNLQKLCDTYLNEPSNGEVEYRPLTNYVIFSFNLINYLKSIDPPYSERGIINEQEGMFWILTMVGKQKGPIFQVDRLAWFVPNLYINRSPSLISGREVYGLPKQIGQIHHSPPQLEDDRVPDLLALDTLTFKKFAPESQAEFSRLIEINKIDRGDSHPAIKPWESFTEAAREIHKILCDLDSNFKLDGTIEVPTLSLPFHLIDYVSQRIVPVVALKQFRDVEYGQRACYQSIVELPMQLTKFHGGRPYAFGNFGDRFEFKIYKYESEPLVEQMGLSTINTPGEDAYRIPVKLALFLNFDFLVKSGKTVWEAKTTK